MIAANPWAVVPRAAAIVLRANPSALSWDEKALFASASFQFDPLMLDGSPEALAAAKSKVAAEAEVIANASADALTKQMPVAECPGSTKISVIIGDVVIGSNNEIVKWARNAWNDITKGPGPNNELRKLVDNAAKAAAKAVDDVLPDITVGKGHGGLGVQIGNWNFEGIIANALHVPAVAKVSLSAALKPNLVASMITARFPARKAPDRTGGDRTQSRKTPVPGGPTLGLSARKHRTLPKNGGNKGLRSTLLNRLAPPDLLIAPFCEAAV